VEAVTTSSQIKMKNIDSVYIKIFIKKNNLAVFSYFDAFNNFVQLIYEPKKVDTVYKVCIENKQKNLLYFTNQFTSIPILLDNNDTININYNNNTLSINSNFYNNSTSNLFNSLYKTKKSIFQYEIESLRIPIAQRNIVLQEYFDSTIFYLNKNKSSIKNIVYDLSINVSKYIYYKNKLIRSAVDKSSTLNLLLDSVTTLINDSSFCYLKEHKDLVRTYCLTRWGNDFVNPTHNKKIYDSVSKNLFGRIRDEKLFAELSAMRAKKAEYYPLYLKQFYADCKTTSLLEYVKENYEENERTNTRVLENSNKQKITWDEMINKNKNAVLYIDFWASWCRPCREEFPVANKVIELYVGKPLKYVFVSIDAIRYNWMNAIKMEKTDGYMNNFLISDVLNSSLTKEFNLNTIPRYIIINKKGKVVNMDAPRPSDPKLKPLLDKLIAE
jgi:thiol-disulfide isomerase/thioredoxin